MRESSASSDMREKPRPKASAESKRSSLLRHPVFGRTFAAYSIAVFGDWFDAIAIQVLIGYRWQVGAMEIALVPICMAVPGILLGAAAGAAADRFDRLKLMKICDLLTALATVLILFAPSIGWLLPILALRAALGTFNVPAQQALTRRVVREERLLDASSLNGLVGQLSRVAGPLLGAALLALVSPQACIAVNAAARLVSFGILRTMPKPAVAAAEVDAAAAASKDGDGAPDPSPAVPAPGADGEAGSAQGGTARRPRAADEAPRSGGRPRASAALREGWAFVRRTPSLRALMLFAFCGILIIQMIDFQFVSLIRVLAPREEGALGWLLASSGAAAAGVAAANMRLARLRGAGRAFKLGASYALLGLSILLLGLLPPEAPKAALLAAGLLLGAGNGLFMVTFNYVLQTETPADMTGRIFGIQTTLHSAVMIAAPPLGGLLVQRFGPSPIFAATGSFVLGLGLFAPLLLKRLRSPRT